VNARIKDRFPLTITLVGFWTLAFLTLPFLSLSIDTTPLISAKAQIAFTMFLGGIVLLVITSILFTGGFNLIKPAENLAKPLTQGQSLVLVTGFFLLGIWQTYVNQATIQLALRQAASLTVPFTTALLFSVDTAIGEEALFGSLTIMLFLALVYFRVSRLMSAVLTLLSVAIAFAAFHIYVYGTTPAALWFVFGARIVLSGTLLATLKYSRSTRNPAASMAAPVILHTAWNGLAF
jgi:hypothetical protein